MHTDKKITPFKRIMIANRGEIAVRIVRACKELGIECVSVYASNDRSSIHVSMADYAVCLPGSTLTDTYLNISNLIAAAKLSGSDGIHPGYGFLSENHNFVSAIEKTEGIRFIGPSSDAMKALGNKTSAKSLMEKMNIPVLSGTNTPLSSYTELETIANKIGYPIVLKAACGGGGKGMRISNSISDLREAYDACKREALSYFADDSIYCERYLINPRHIEFQTIFDHHGNGVHLFERDCSIQRRYQKLIEEAPSIYLSTEQRKKIGELSVQIGLSVGYHGAATVEYICESPEKFYFMEINTRIQVEHPATEMITGIDLIKETIKIAEYRPLSFDQAQINFQGHAIEARINAEDPSVGFVPNVGVISNLYLPNGPFIRVDTHIYCGYTLTDRYDSLLAKIIVWGQDRHEAIERLKRALTEMQINGLTTTESFHLGVLNHPEFIKGDIYTNFISDQRQYFSDYYQRLANFKCLSTRLGDKELLTMGAAMVQMHEYNIGSNKKITDDRSKWSDFSAEHAVNLK